MAYYVPVNKKDKVPALKGAYWTQNICLHVTVCVPESRYLLEHMAP